MIGITRWLVIGGLLPLLAGCYVAPPPVSYYTAPCPAAGAVPPDASAPPPPAGTQPPPAAAAPGAPQGEALCTYAAPSYAYGYPYGPGYYAPYYEPWWFGPSFGFVAVGGGGHFHGGGFHGGHFHGGGHFH